MSKHRYNTTTDALDRLHSAVDRVRSTSDTVRVNKTDLVNLLLDHSQLAGLVLELGVRVEEKESRPCPVAPSCQPEQDRDYHDPHCDGREPCGCPPPPRSASQFIAECDRLDREAREMLKLSEETVERDLWFQYPERRGQ